MPTETASKVTSPAIGASALIALRLRHQQIAHPVFQTPAQVLGWLGGIQGQDYPGAKWSIGLRLPGATDADVDRAIAEGAIVRTWPMRGTLHFVAAPDVHWLLALTAPRNIAAAARRRQQLGLNDKVLGQSAAVLTKALQGGRQRTRDELLALLQAAGIPVDSHTGYHLLWHAAASRLICFAAPRGKQQTFALLDEWVPSDRRQTPDEPRAELARRYFRSRGPATWPDYLWWSGLAAADARAGFEMIKPGLISARLAGKDYWMAPDATGEANEPPPGKAGPRVAYALPGFDEYLLGYQDRSVVLDARHADKICPGGNGVFISTFVLNGRIAGAWGRAAGKNQITITTEPFAALGKTGRHLLTQAVNRYGSFLGRSVQLR